MLREPYTQMKKIFFAWALGMVLAPQLAFAVQDPNLVFGSKLINGNMSSDSSGTGTSTAMTVISCTAPKIPIISASLDATNNGSGGAFIADGILSFISVDSTSTPITSHSLGYTGSQEVSGFWARWDSITPGTHYLRFGTYGASTTFFYAVYESCEYPPVIASGGGSPPVDNSITVDTEFMFCILIFFLSFLVYPRMFRLLGRVFRNKIINL